jgi:hypothetical protein
VRQKEWVQDLSNRDRLRVSFVTGKGPRKVVRIAVVQYEAEIEGEWRALVRYDQAHGYLHRDVANPDGTQEKLIITYTDLAEALTQILAEIRHQWPFYRRRYEEMTKC